MNFVWSGLSDKGLKRTSNEDAYVCVPEFGLFVVADGVGGHLAGEVASRLAVESIVERMRQVASDDDLTPVHDPQGHDGVPVRRLLIAIEHANERVFEDASRDERHSGMGTTVAAIYLVHGFVNICHVGDSRVYRIREGDIVPLTEDHVVMGNVLSRAVGAAPLVEPSWRIEPAAAGDVFVLCSDGIHGPVADEEIRDVVDGAPNCEAACASLVALANSRGGPDNSTVVMVRLGS